MDLPQPPAGMLPNIEVIWAGDAKTNHLSVSMRIGTFFGVTNAFAESVAREIVDCEQLCECDIHADTGDLMASFHVAPEHWSDFAHAAYRKVFQHVAKCTWEWNKRSGAPEVHVVDEKLHVSHSRRLN